MTDYNIDFATATPAELEALGFSLTVKKSQAKTRRTRKSALGVRPSCNSAGHVPTPLVDANQNHTGYIN